MCVAFTWAPLTQKNFRDCIHRALDILLAGLPIAHADAHGASSSPRRAAEECLASSCNRDDYLIRLTIMVFIGGQWSAVEKTHKPLIDYRLPQDFRSGQTADLRYEGMSVYTASFDQRG